MSGPALGPVLPLEVSDVCEKLSGAWVVKSGSAVVKPISVVGVSDVASVTPVEEDDVACGANEVLSLVVSTGSALRYRVRQAATKRTGRMVDMYRWCEIFMSVLEECSEFQIDVG